MATQITGNKSVKKAAYRLIFWQLIVVVGLALALFLLKGNRSGLSALLGGLSYWLPNLVFVWRVFARVSASAAKSIVVSFFAGEIAKLFLSAILFVAIAKWLPVSALAMLVGYVGAIVGFWFVCAVYLVRHPGVSV